MEVKNIYYPNKRIMESGPLNDLGKQGKWRYFSEEGSLVRMVEYLNDQKNGQSTRYFPNGIIAVQFEYKNDILDGPGFEYYSNGKIKEEWKYENGKYHPINFWNEEGEQILINGTGYTIFHGGVAGLEISRIHLKNGQYIGEEKISKITRLEIRDIDTESDGELS